VELSRRRTLVWEAFTQQQRTSTLHNPTTPLVTLVKKLQESLTRMESFDVVTVSQGSDGS
jgi:E3 ubiquitin-protein ligase TRIP12